MLEKYSFDVVVIGGGHAGCEAALSAARLGCATLMLTISLDNVALMPCNPSIGGPAKGHIVREIDALGGEMARNTDKTSIQTRMLNTGKGPAVHALRAQCDKRLYHQEMLKVLENQENLSVKQAIVKDIVLEGNRIAGVVTHTGMFYQCKALVLTSGTYLEGKVIVGETSYLGGPNGQIGAYGLSENLRRIGIEIGRFKTGTPPRVHRDSIDFDRMIIQPGDEKRYTFSFEGTPNDLPQLPCYLTYTNEKTHQVIRENIGRSPLYSGRIAGVGPRYCPCIEDKVMRFTHKETHQLFLEPEGINTAEYYVQGMHTSMPEDVQLAMLRSIKGLERAEIMRAGYSIEYDYIIPTQLTPALMLRKIPGFFAAGQVNGTSGYEEAAGQGLIAGINAAFYVQGREPVVLDRSQAYIGVLVDDLVTKGTNEPYRMLTSRAEYRLLLRNDNADLRLTQLGYEIGLISKERYERFTEKRQKIQEEFDRLHSVTIYPIKDVQEKLRLKQSTELSNPVTAAELLRRPEISHADVLEILGETANLSEEVVSQVETQIKYEGYIRKQMEQVEKFKKLEEKKIPEELDYGEIYGLSTEAREKLMRFRPRSVGQASRISGISPADISVILVYLEKLRRKQA